MRAFEKRGAVVYRRVRRIKGTWPSDVVRHHFDPKAGGVKSKPGVDEEEWLYIQQWAENGQPALLACAKHYGAAQTYIDQCGYSCYAAHRERDSWGLWHKMVKQPERLRSYGCGKADDSVAALDDMVAGKEAVLPVVREGTPEDLHQG